LRQFTIPVLYGVGSGGCRIAATIVHGTGPAGRRVRQKLNTLAVCVSSSSADTEQVSGFEEVVTFTIGDGMGSGMDPEKGRRDYLGSPHRSDIISLPERVAGRLGWSRIDLIPVVLTAGFGCGSGAGPELVADLVKRYRDSMVLGICTLPFKYEGEETYRRAVKAFERASKHAPVLAVSNQYIASMMADAGFVETLNYVNDRIASILHTFIRSMGSEKVVTAVDSSDFRKVLRPAPALLMQWSLQTPDEIPRISQHNSNTLAPVARGLGKVSCIAVVEAGLAGGQLKQSHIDALHPQVEEVTGARIKEFKAMVTARPEANRTYVTVLIGGVKFYA